MKKELQNVDNRQDFVELEHKYLKWWDENDIVKKYMSKNSEAKETFSFIDGPITANNPMGLHHAWARTYKDLVCRYRNMKGFNQRFQMGFDCQGLWVEVEVEKALGFNSKKDIDEYGLGNFTDACVARVNEFSAIQTKQSVRLGMFMDWVNSYYTMSKENNLYIWNFLKRCNEKGLLYKSHSATTWCPRCETGLSEHEKADGYKEIEDVSVYVKFKVLGRRNEYILAWTTTPWTLSANVLLALNKGYEYVRAEKDGDIYYLAAKPARRLGFKEVQPINVEELLKMKYESLYDIPAMKGVDHYVVEWDLASQEDGTGIVHIAPGCGQEDYELGLEVGAPAVSPLDESGRYGEGYGELTGKYAHDVKDMVFEYLDKKGLLFKIEHFKHVYPHCWRCKTKCLFRLENNWFINLGKIKEKLKSEANKVEWVPDYSGKRMQDWLNNMGDWMISRKRFYGLSLPFYECDCGEVTVVGGLEELRKLAVDPKKVDELKSIHRPWVDEIKIRCPKCGKEVERIKDVGDCWLDAGVVPFSTLKYLEDKDYWKRWFPADYITEMIEQVRLWYYSMLVFGVVLEGKVPFKRALSFAEMRDEKNEKMSKTKKNYIPFDEAADKVGSDLIRWNFSQSPYGKNVKFGWNVIEDAKRQFLLPFWNSYSYFVTYAKLNGWVWDKDYSNRKLKHSMDKWIVEAYRKLVVDVTEDMDRYLFYSATSKIKSYMIDLSTWYIRGNRDRFKSGDKDALDTLHFILVELVKMLAPFMPFVTEDIYQNLVVNTGMDRYESVHLEDYPFYEKSDIDRKVLQNMEDVRKVCSLGLKIRDENKLGIRQPLSKAYVKIYDDTFKNLIMAELNVKDIEVVKEPLKDKIMPFSEDGDLFVALDINLTEDLKMEGAYREMVRKVQDSRKKAGLKMGELAKLVVVKHDSFIEGVLKKYSKDLKLNTGLKSVEYIGSLKGGLKVDIKGSMFEFKIEKTE